MAKGDLKRMLFDNTAASDNTRIESKKPMETPKLDKEYKKDLEYVDEGVKVNRDGGDLKVRTSVDRLLDASANFNKNNADVLETYRKDDGSERDVKVGETDWFKMKKNEDETGKAEVKNEDIRPTREYEPLDAEGKTAWQRVLEVDPNAPIEEMKKQGVDPEEYIEAINAEKSYEKTNGKKRLGSILFNQK